MQAAGQDHFPEDHAAVRDPLQYRYRGLVDAVRRGHLHSYLIQPPPSDPASVVYLTITDRSYPRKLAFSYLDELAREFGLSYGRQVAQPTLRPYAFVAFDTFMQRTKRLYADSRTAETAAGSHLDRLNEDLQDVQKIMTKNMEDLLWRGDSLDRA